MTVDAALRPPGLYVRFAHTPASPLAVETGVPVFLGFTRSADRAADGGALAAFGEFRSRFGGGAANGYLEPALQGFFANGGRRCHVVPLGVLPGPADAAAAPAVDPAGITQAVLAGALERLAEIEGADLVCAPDVALVTDPVALATLQLQILDHCASSGRSGAGSTPRFAILDAVRPQTALPAAEGGLPARAGVEVQREKLAAGTDGALYFPWLKVAGADVGALVDVPPCGHVAGVYARVDAERGFFAAPANAVVEGIVDLTAHLEAAAVGGYNNLGINCLRVVPGRGVRVWGARTLAGAGEWRYVNVRRLFKTTQRWIEANLAAVAFEPLSMLLWVRIRREVEAYCRRLYDVGALQGRTPEEAFFVKCDAETNPPSVVDAGQVVTVVGLAPLAPSEFILMRITHNPNTAVVESTPVS